MKFLRVILLFSLIFFTLFTKAQSVAGSISGVPTPACPGSYSGILLVIGSVGNIFNWQTSTDGGITWTYSSVGGSYNNLTQTTCYRVIVQNGAFAPDTSAVACITVYSPSVSGTITGGGVFCGGSGGGTLNLSGNTGNVLCWKNSTDGGITWDTVFNTTTSLNYTNITQNTLYSVVVQNGLETCPKDSTQVSFVINPISVAGTLSGNDTVCYGSNTISLNLTGAAGNVVSWLTSTDNGITWVSVANTDTSLIYTNLTQTSWYQAVVQNGTCNTDTSQTVTIKVLPANPVNAGNDTTIALGGSLVLHGVGSGTPNWSPATGLDNPNSYTPFATPQNSTSYMLSVTDSNSCISSDTILIIVIQPQFGEAVPNIFTPNDDGINDFFELKNIINNENAAPLQIFNRWGVLIFSSELKAIFWDGRTTSGLEVSNGVYYYTITMDNKLFTGFVQLIR